MSWLDAPESEIEQRAIELARAREAGGNKQTLRAGGVVHTPLPLVRYALSRVHEALRAQLGLAEGLCSEQVVALDPAAGTGVWLAALLALTRESPRQPSFLGFDTDAAVLELAAGLLAPASAAQGATLSLHHQNTLALPAPFPDATKVRLVMGNPPWGARSRSRGLALSDEWLREFHQDAQGVALNESRSGVLSDDYVRFFRWAMEQARTAERGAVVCLVTNASFVDGPVHRGMRAALLATFDSIELLDLGGNALLSRGQERDQGLFPVRVGAALTLCVRRPGNHARSAQLTYGRLTGDRKQKLAALYQAIPTVTFRPVAPAHRFRSGSTARPSSAGFALSEAFPFHAEGVQTNRDVLATAATRDELLTRLERIVRGEVALPESRHFRPAVARLEIERALSAPDAAMAELAYRPFEQRVYCTVAPLCHRPRPALRRAVAASTLSLLSVRKEPGALPWNMFGAVRQMADSSFLSVRSSCRTRMFPSHGPEGEPNLSSAVAARFADTLGRSVTSVELIAYALGVLGSPRYRAEQGDSLKYDYPHLPWPRHLVQFTSAVAAGRLFTQILADGAATHPDVSLEGEAALSTSVRRAALRWLSPHQIEVAPGAQIRAGERTPLTAHVGHHAIVASAFRNALDVTIDTVLTACRRAAMWGDAEKAADDAYRAASSVCRDANAVAVGD